MSSAGQIARSTFAGLAWGVLGVLLLVASLVLHIDSALGRAAAGQLVTSGVESQIPGRMTIGEVTHVGADGALRARDVSFETAGGQRVVWGDEVDVDLDLTAALSGDVRLTQLDVTGGGVHVSAPKEGRTSIERAFSEGGPGGPPEDAAGIDLHSHLEGVSLTLDVADGPSLRFREIRGFMRVTRAASGWMRVRLVRIEGTSVKQGPLKRTMRVHSLSGLVAAGADRILDMRFVLELEGSRLEARLEYYIEPKKRVALRVEGHGPKGVLASLGLEGLDAFVGSLEVERGEVRVSQPNER